MSVFKEPLPWIKQSIDSILNQTYQDFEFIIVDDNPDDSNLLATLHEYAKKDARIQIIENSENIGLTKSLNKALRVAKGTYIARMDADDISEIERFSIQAEYLDVHKEVSLCHTNYYSFGEYEGQKELYYSGEVKEFQNLLVWTNPIAHPTVMFRSELLNLRTPFYDEHYRSAQDYELWTFLTLKGVQFAYINQPLLRYRISNTQITRNKTSNQSGNSIGIRRNYIFKRLCQLGVIDKDDISVKDAYKALKRREDLVIDKVELKYILYLFYYHLTNNLGIYQLKYFMDHNRLFGFFGYHENIHVLFHPFFKNRWRRENLY